MKKLLIFYILTSIIADIQAQTKHKGGTSSTEVEIDLTSSIRYENLKSGLDRLNDKVDLISKTQDDMSGRLNLFYGTLMSAVVLLVGLIFWDRRTFGEKTREDIYKLRQLIDDIRLDQLRRENEIFRKRFPPDNNTFD